MSKLFDDFIKEVEYGECGLNGTIPLKLGRLDEYLEISKGTMYLIGAESSAGKTSFAIDQFLVYPIRWFLHNQDQVEMKLDIIYFNLERAQVLNTAKMVCKFIFEDTGRLIDVKKMMGRKKDKITEEEKKLILQYENVVNLIAEHLTVYEGHREVEEIKSIIRDHAMANGEVRKVPNDRGELVPQYFPTEPNHITLIFIDHIGLVSKDKKIMDEFSSVMRKSKDFFKFSPVIIQQLNRNISESSRQGLKNRPKLSDFEGTSSTSQDAEVIISVFNPLTHIHIGADEEKAVLDVNNYDLSLLINKYGIFSYRSLFLLKNTYGGSGLGAGLAFHAPTGTFLTMPKADEITEQDYEDICSGKYFRSSQKALF